MTFQQHTRYVHILLEGSSSTIKLEDQMWTGYVMKNDHHGPGGGAHLHLLPLMLHIGRAYKAMM